MDAINCSWFRPANPCAPTDPENSTSPTIAKFWSRCVIDHVTGRVAGQ